MVHRHRRPFQASLHGHLVRQRRAVDDPEEGEGPRADALRRRRRGRRALGRALAPGNPQHEAGVYELGHLKDRKRWCTIVTTVIAIISFIVTMSLSSVIAIITKRVIFAVY